MVACRLCFSLFTSISSLPPLCSVSVIVRAARSWPSGFPSLSLQGTTRDNLCSWPLAPVLNSLTHKAMGSLGPLVNVLKGIIVVSQLQARCEVTGRWSAQLDRELQLSSLVCTHACRRVQHLFSCWFSCLSPVEGVSSSSPLACSDTVPLAFRSLSGHGRNEEVWCAQDGLFDGLGEITVFNVIK
jgi:hypothetical protein